jgi:hypothetical protein
MQCKPHADPDGKAPVQQMLHRLLAVAVAGMLAVATTMPAGAAGPRREAAPAQAQPAFTQIQNQKLIATSLLGDSVHVTLNAGFSNIGMPHTFYCAVACTVLVQTMVQVEQTSPYWAICPTIDGIDAVQGCNWQGVASTPSSVYVTGNGTYFWSLAPGRHTLQPQVYFSASGGIDNWGLTFTKYNPN